MLGDEPNLWGPRMRLALGAGDGASSAKAHEHEKVTAKPMACASAARAKFDRTDLRILELMGSGLPDAAIGKRLQLSQRTIQRRVCRMMTRIGVHGRFALGLRVSELGILPANDRSQTQCD
ncbi:LuxR C-terminal-related transcriptional regulator [Streptomyces sp. NPDC057375]|uniref:LuxR C-terminal-related transcriptional regulator n=1 Tax=Streptomyces sp. NPDC057375 TaxID=3346109 RepID=UPI00363466B0